MFIFFWQLLKYKKKLKKKIQIEYNLIFNEKIFFEFAYIFPNSFMIIFYLL